MLRLAIAVLATGTLLNAQSPAHDNAFPRTRSYGRATTQYRDSRIKAVVSYDYSQRNHDGPWLFMQIGLAMQDRAVVHRDHFHLLTPDGRMVPLASQEQVLADAPGLVKLQQNAGAAYLQPMRSYFPESASGDRLRFFALPGQRTISDTAVVPATKGVVIGDLFFRSPTLRWEDGTYRLVFDHEKGRAELPIRLE